MTKEIPQYGLKAYAMLFIRHGFTEEFTQHDLDWIVSQSMKKKIFSLLLNSGWIEKQTRNTYICIRPEKVITSLLNFRLPDIMKKAAKPYAFADLSAVEIWSDYSYVQRGLEKSPYFIRVLKKDLKWWKRFFNENDMSCYINKGTTIGEYVILEPVESLKPVTKNGLEVTTLQETVKFARSNAAYSYAYKYMVNKYGSSSNQRS